MVEFMISHMAKNFKLDLYRKCLGVVHRMLCYQKRCKIRLNYNWKELWVGLLNLLKFFAASEEHLLPKLNIFAVAIEASAPCYVSLCCTHNSTIVQQQ
jgi:hypothetical protein